MILAQNIMAAACNAYDVQKIADRIDKLDECETVFFKCDEATLALAWQKSKIGRSGIYSFTKTRVSESFDQKGYLFTIHYIEPISIKVTVVFAVIAMIAVATIAVKAGLLGDFILWMEH